MAASSARFKDAAGSAGAPRKRWQEWSPVTPAPRSAPFAWGASRTCRCPPLDLSFTIPKGSGLAGALGSLKRGASGCRAGSLIPLQRGPLQPRKAGGWRDSPAEASLVSLSASVLWEPGGLTGAAWVTRLPRRQAGALGSSAAAPQLHPREDSRNLNPPPFSSPLPGKGLQLLWMMRKPGTSDKQAAVGTTSELQVWATIFCMAPATPGIHNLTRNVRGLACRLECGDMVTAHCNLDLLDSRAFPPQLLK
ncbi:uncharacterized protein LOC118142919 [Callithrix jacchus]